MQSQVFYSVYFAGRYQMKSFCCVFRGDLQIKHLHRREHDTRTTFDDVFKAICSDSKNKISVGPGEVVSCFVGEEVAKFVSSKAVAFVEAPFFDTVTALVPEAGTRVVYKITKLLPPRFVKFVLISITIRTSFD